MRDYSKLSDSELARRYALLDTDTSATTADAEAYRMGQIQRLAEAINARNLWPAVTAEIRRCRNLPRFD